MLPDQPAQDTTPFFSTQVLQLTSALFPSWSFFLYNYKAVPSSYGRPTVPLHLSDPWSYLPLVLILLLSFLSPPHPLGIKLIHICPVPAPDLGPDTVLLTCPALTHSVLSSQHSQQSWDMVYSPYPSDSSQSQIKPSSYRKWYLHVQQHLFILFSPFLLNLF